jgi:transposase-like protein
MSWSCDGTARLEPVYPVLVIDASWVRILDGQVASRSVYVTVGA